MRRRALLAASQPSGGGDWGEEITFYIDTKPLGGLYTLTAREGMTWADWVNTDYNTMGIVISYDGVGDGYVDYMGLVIVSYDSGVSVHPQDEIMAYTYGL